MNKIILILFFFCSVSYGQNKTIFDARQGAMTFFSYTSVENIKAQNNQVYSRMDSRSGEIAVRILMRAFKFEKSLMEQHFNESYIESDLYPEATFTGTIINFDETNQDNQTRMIKGDFTLRGVTVPLEFKATINKTSLGYAIQGKLDVSVKDYNIRIPALLSPNIAKTIQVEFNFEYGRHEN